MTQVRRVGFALIALALLGACGEKSPTGPKQPPTVNLDGVAFHEDSLPDPCEVLRAAGAKELLVRPLDGRPILAPGFCLLQVDREGRDEPQTSAALELLVREQPVPTNMDEYVEQFGEGLNIAGCKPEDVQTIPGLGDFSIWFPHKYPPDTNTITLTSFWGGRNFLSLEIHRIDRKIALAWAKDVAAQVIQRVPAVAAAQSPGDENQP